MTSKELKQTLSVEDCTTALAYSMFIDPDDIEAVEALLIKWSSPVITRDLKPVLRADRDNTLSDMAAVSNVPNFQDRHVALQYAVLRLHMDEWRAGKYVYDKKSYQALIDMFNGGNPLEETKETFLVWVNTHNPMTPTIRPATFQKTYTHGVSIMRICMESNIIHGVTMCRITISSTEPEKVFLRIKILVTM